MNGLSDDDIRQLRGAGYSEVLIDAVRGQQMRPRLKLKFRARGQPRPERRRLPFVIEWRNAFTAVRDTSREAGLPSTTRLVLWTISKFMDGDGSNAHPGLERIAKDAGLSLPAVKAHVQIAVSRAWLRRKLNYRSRYGVGYQYEAAIPNQATSLPGNDPTEKPGRSKRATSDE